MRRFVTKILLFCGIIILIDLIAGIVFSNLIENARGGDNWRNNNIVNEVNDDILIFGSSRAIHHYNPQIIEDSLGLSCYNCGQDGNGIVLSYARIQILKQRYQPKMIIFDITDEYDLREDDKHRYLGWLKPYYDNFSLLKEVFNDVDFTEKYKMQSNMYQYNSKFLQVISDVVSPMQTVGNKGYRPEYGVATKMPKPDFDSVFTVDSLKLRYWKELIDTRAEIEYVFIVSPTLAGRNSNRYVPLKNICMANGVKFYDMSNAPEFIGNLSLFLDGSHLNSKGADLFTQKIVSILR